MGLEVGLEQKVSVLQHAFEPGANSPGADHGAGRTERRSVFDSVGEAAGVRPIRIEDMQMSPVRERPFYLLVRELASWNAISVAG